MTQRLRLGLSLIILCSLIGGIGGVAATDTPITPPVEQSHTQLNGYTGVKSVPDQAIRQADNGDTGEITAWVPPPIPDGLSITPLEYLSLWAESYTQSEAEIILTEAGFTENEISTAAEQYQAGIQRGRLYTRTTPEAKAYWNTNSTAHARSTSDSASKIKWNTGRSSPTKDGSLYLRDVSYDLSTIEPSTIVMAADDASPTQRDSERIYVAGDTLQTTGTFDYRIDEPEDRTYYNEVEEQKERIRYYLQDVSISGPSLTINTKGEGPARTLFGGGSANSGSTATSSSINLQDISRKATLEAEVEVSVSYERHKDRLYFGDPVRWIELDEEVKTDTVTVSEKIDIYVADKQAVKVQYRPIEDNDASGRIDVTFPDNWAAINFPDGTTLVSPRSAYTQRDFSYGFARTLTENGAEYVRPTHTPVRSYYVGTADAPRLIPSTQSVPGVGRWNLGVTQYTGQTIYTEKAPSHATKATKSEYMSAKGASITITPEQSDLSIGEFLNQTTAVGPAPGQELAVDINKRPPVAQANITATYVPANEANANAERVLEVTVTEAASGEPIATRGSSELNVTVAIQRGGAEAVTLNTNDAGKATVELTGTPRVQAIINEGVDASSGKLIQSDVDSASYTNASRFIRITPWYLLETYIFPLIPIVLVVTLLEKAITGSSTVGRIIFR